MIGKINEAKTFKYISNKEFIQEVYKKNKYMPFWFTNKGVNRKFLDDFFKTISSDEVLDKNGNIYRRYQYLKNAFNQGGRKSLDRELMLDVQLSSLYKSYLTFHIYGSIQWWDFQRKLKWLRNKKISPIGSHTLPNIIYPI